MFPCSQFRSVIASVFATKSKVKKSDVVQAVHNTLNEEVPEQMYTNLMKEFAVFDKSKSERRRHLGPLCSRVLFLPSRHLGAENWQLCNWRGQLSCVVCRSNWFQFVATEFAYFIRFAHANFVESSGRFLQIVIPFILVRHLHSRARGPGGEGKTRPRVGDRHRGATLQTVLKMADDEPGVSSYV